MWKEEELCGFPWSDERLLESRSLCVLLTPRLPWYLSITWALMQLHIGQHLRIVLAAVGLFVKYHRGDNDNRRKYTSVLKINDREGECGNGERWRTHEASTTYSNREHVEIHQRFPRSITEVYVYDVCVAVRLCWPSWWSCWRAQWPCRSKCWEGRAFWWLGTCLRRSVKGLHSEKFVLHVMFICCRVKKESSLVFTKSYKASGFVMLM